MLRHVSFIKINFYDFYFQTCGNANHQVKPTSSRIYECLYLVLVVDTMYIYFICTVLN